MNTELVFALICGALLGAGVLAGKLGLIDRLPPSAGRKPHMRCKRWM